MGLMFIGWKNRAILFITEISSQNVPDIIQLLPGLCHEIRLWMFVLTVWRMSAWKQQLFVYLRVNWICRIWFAATVLNCSNCKLAVKTCELLTCPYKTTSTVAVPWMVPNGNMGIMVYSGLQVWDLNRKLGLQNVLFSMLLTLTCFLAF